MTQEGTKFITRADGTTPKVVAMCEFKGEIIVACEDGVYRLIEREGEHYLAPIEILVQ